MTVHGGERALGFCLNELEVGMLCIYKNKCETPGRALPIRMGRVLRLAEDVPKPFVVVESWWPLAKPDKYNGRDNLFGTWLPGAVPQVVGSSGKAKKPRVGGDNLMVDTVDVLLWPIELDSGASDHEGGGRIPFVVLHRVREWYGIDVADPVLTFAKRGFEFYSEAVQRVARDLHDQSRPDTQGKGRGKS